MERLLASARVHIELPERTARAVRGGHPWVYRDGLPTAEVGAIAVLTHRGRVQGWGLVDEGPIAVRVLGREAPPAGGLPAVLRDRVLRADRVRRSLVEADTDAMRVLNGAGDGLPGLVLDRYGSLAILRVYARAWERWLPDVVSAVRALGWPECVCRRLGVERVDGSSGLVHLAGEAVPDVLVVEERGMRVLVRPAQGQKTGLFLDQREHRALVGRWASGRRVANLFAYTGGFSVAAALGGAARVATVDLAPDAIDDARENFRLNGLDPDAHAFEVADAFAWEPPGGADLIVVDPPSLARRGASEGAARSAYRKLHRRLGPHLARDGLLASSSCTARLTLDAWRAALQDGLAPMGTWAWHWVSTEPPDHPVALAHPEGRYLKFALLRKLWGRS